MKLDFYQCRNGADQVVWKQLAGMRFPNLWYMRYLQLGDGAESDTQLVPVGRLID